MRKWEEKVKTSQPDDFKDPYLTAIEYKDMSVCKICHDIYHNKRWVKDEALYNRLIKDSKKKVSYTVCPSCRKIETHYAEGIVELKGDFLFAHKDDILNLIKNTEKRADYIDPLEKVESIDMDEENKTIKLTTTSEDLAQRIGKNIEKAYHGSVEFSFSKDDRLVRVYWTK